MPHAEWIEELAVQHRAKADNRWFRASGLYYDYMDPPVAHRLDVRAPYNLRAARLPDSVREGLEPEQPLARLLVNEFPLHMKRDTRDSWLWFFDSCDRGPSAHLGGGIDYLLEEGEIGFGTHEEGAVLHLQNLEVHPDYRRLGIGTRLIQYAIAVLSRSDQDLAVGEYMAIRPMYEPLFPDPESSLPTIQREEPGVVRSFMASVGFRRTERIMGRDILQSLPEPEPEPPNPIFYRSITWRERVGWLGERK